MENHKHWVAPIWMKLIMDVEAQHYHRMKNAVWLFLYLFFNAERGSGSLSRKVETISSEMGIKRDTIIRWLGVLRKHGYIATRNTGRGLFIQIRQCGNPSPDVGNMTQQKQEKSDLCGEGNPITEKVFTSQNQQNFNKKPADPIDISINKNIYNIDIDRNDSSDLPLKCIKHFKPRDKQQFLAFDLARELHDRQGLPFYLSCTKKYPESVLRKVLGQVKEVPFEKITKSRAALFNHMIQQYDQEDSKHLSH